jgi:anhydro-N-acetylmuramic acid kinase
VKIAGIMSGTSLDGIDVAIVEIRGARVHALGFQSTPYPEAVRTALLVVSNANTHTAAISRLNFQLGELYAKAVLRAIRRFGAVELIGCHGQTIYHEGRSNTLQIGEAAVLAERTGVPVVSNFRARDIAAGGQGAPLVPFVDYLLFRHAKRTRVALNIGGIANITVIPPGARPEEVIAFDTGPGNMVIDALAREYHGDIDRDGKIAAAGHVNRALLDELLADDYYRRRPPKSAGREQYGAEFVARMKASGLTLPNLFATS